MPSPVPRCARERFLAACRCQPVDRPPVWLMRQAGRCLPEYRRLKEHHSFLELIHTPELAAEVTLQPVRRFGFDAAILFSDILVIPEALGQGFHFREAGGVEMAFALRSAGDIEKLCVEGMAERLEYVARTLRLVRQALGEQTALIGFSGSPWTLATFMMEGGSVPHFTRARELFRTDFPTYCRLAEKLTAAIVAYLRMQIAAGVDAIQLFDSHGGQLSPTEFPEASARWMREIIQQLRVPEPRASVPPIIVFSLGTHRNWVELVETGADVLGVDSLISLATVRRRVPERVALQGNLAPVLLSEARPEILVRETRAVLEAMRGRPGHIFNLGHGVPPNARLENIRLMLETVHEFR